MSVLVERRRLKAVTQVSIWPGGGTGAVVAVAGCSSGLGVSSAVLAELGQLLLRGSPGPASLVIIMPTFLLKHA